MIAGLRFILVLCHVFKLSQAYVDSVIPVHLKEPYESSNGNRAEMLDKNVRLLAVMNLMHQEWQLYNEHWYKLFEIELQWVQAENFCRELGGHLASIADAAENDFVHHLRKKNNIWIGLNKVNDPNGVYEWGDGTKAEYLNWDSTQPNEPEVDCVYMAYNQEKRGTWFDYACNQKLPQFFVCKLKL